MKEEEPDQTDSEEMLIDYMNRILCQKVFTEIEQAKICNDDGGGSRISLPEKCIKAAATALRSCVLTIA